MAQNQKVRGVATCVYTDDKGDIHIRYHKTDVVVIDDEMVTLDSGGWRTATTKLRMNQAANEYRLGFQVYQHRHEWFVQCDSGHTFLFHDGMRFSY